jgi:hypothetical protein
MWFSLRLKTITRKNEADFAPEFLLELLKKTAFDQCNTCPLLRLSPALSTGEGAKFYQ